MFSVYCLVFIAYCVITILLNISIRLWYSLCFIAYLSISYSYSYSYVANIDLFSNILLYNPNKNLQNPIFL